MLGIYLPSLLLFLFGLFSLLGIRHELVINHLIFFAVGLIIFFVIKAIGFQFFRLNAKFFYWLFVILLIVTFIVGIEVKGSRRWISFFFFNFQASEFFKIFFVVFMADFLAKPRMYTQQLRAFLESLGYVAFPALIIFKQPDLATALTFVFIYGITIFFSTIPKKYIFSFLLIAVLVIPLGFFSLHDYQKARIIGFFNPQVDTKGTSYNVTQAIIAVGSGQFFGKGLGLGTQSELHFLPENHTDFAFASLIEQFGFVGGSVIIVLYVVLGYSLVKKIVKYFYQKDDEGRYKFFYTLGFFAFFIFQVLINIGMNLGLTPIAGITLPLISYGGSSLVTWMVGLAMLP